MFFPFWKNAYTCKWPHYFKDYKRSILFEMNSLEG